MTTRSRALAMVLVLAAWTSTFLRAEETEERATKAVEKLRGKIYRFTKRPGQPAVNVDLRGTEVTDADLKDLKDFKSLRMLTLRQTGVTDAGLKELKELKNLDWLDLSTTKVTDAGLSELKELKNLRVLQLSGTPVTITGEA